MILLTHPPVARELYYSARALAALQELGAVRLNRDGPLSGDKLIRAAAGCQVIVADRAVPASAAIFDALPELVAFVRNAVDIRTVDVAAASAAGVLVTQASPGFVPAVTELVLATTIDLCRGISAGVCHYRAGRQPPPRMGRQLAGSTVGVIGYGSIGRRLVRMLRALEADVLVHDPYADVADVTAVGFRDLLARSSVVICLATATPETAQLVDRAAFAAMQPGALFVNASRGELVDEAALADALDRGHLAGAALDVGSAADQMPSFELASRPDVVATPHIGGLTAEAAEHQAMETVRQTEAILRHEAPPGSVNKAFAHRLLDKSRRTS
jgi:D-3-phosphoglycerate dehydrogenase